MREDATHSLARKYRVISWFYDILDYPWERQYRHWRPLFLKDVDGTVLEAGVGTGRNLRHYPLKVHVTGIDLSPEMLTIAKRSARKAACSVTLLQQDAVSLRDVPSDHFDWYIATFLYCVLPDELQPRALEEMIRVLKPGGRFKLLEIVYSKNENLRRRQERVVPFVEKLYGARFDRHTLEYLKRNDHIEILSARFLKADTYLLIEGRRKTI
ncbi:class I SAM-dependent methyltransferase [Candidatus Peregrinibacteria bacterium CG10_big_fil_rev_8_21_14_0_10_49_16]|nr:MAG: methyltransferase type 11 [Candidatus Peregrinibacteria bacterium CG22_combo_CG10-13_8_21_14_all_49_11]PIR52060.1 MAG: class I SAM-dependent methyltransferase [Candidatus Peregrinibacteria bacterium CG10_big_fil_rev_8_21_14_0_10_49_16]